LYNNGSIEAMSRFPRSAAELGIALAIAPEKKEGDMGFIFVLR
jgi:hypothetical protein